MDTYNGRGNKVTQISGDGTQSSPLHSAKNLQDRGTNHRLLFPRGRDTTIHRRYYSDLLHGLAIPFHSAPLSAPPPGSLCITPRPGLCRRFHVSTVQRRVVVAFMQAQLVGCISRAVGDYLAQLFADLLHPSCPSSAMSCAWIVMQFMTSLRHKLFARAEARPKSSSGQRYARLLIAPRGCVHVRVCAR